MKFNAFRETVPPGPSLAIRCISNELVLIPIPTVWRHIFHPQEPEYIFLTIQQDTLPLLPVTILLPFQESQCINSKYLYSRLRPLLQLLRRKSVSQFGRLFPHMSGKRFGTRVVELIEDKGIPGN